MYKIESVSAVKSDVRKLDKQLQRIIKEEHFANIEKDPFKATSLSYEFKVVYSRGIKEGLLGRFTVDELLSRYSERREGNPYTKAYTKEEAQSLFSRYFNSCSIEVHYNVIDLPQQRKVKVGLPDEYELGWHLVVKAVK
jgi:hypothetical protein